MGTRHLTCVKLDGDFKIAQYGQWDGYFEGQGLTVLRFLRSLTRSKYKTFVDKLRKCSWLTDDQVNALYAGLGINITDGWISIDDGKKFGYRYPELSRDTGAKVLQLVLASENGLGLVDHRTFAGDSLFCEYAYVVDLDARPRRFEVYVGFNKKPLDSKERFASYTGREGYYPIRLLTTFKLCALPADGEFVKQCAEAGEKNDA